MIRVLTDDGNDMQIVPPQVSSGENPMLRILEWVLSATGGFLAALVTFRTKVALMDRRFDEQDKKIDEYKTHLADHRNDVMAEALRTERAFRDSLDAMRQESDERHEDNRGTLRLLRRQQFLTLKMIADIARHTGADKRFDDAIWSALAADQDEEST